jgi:hypothetical protein
MLSRCFTLCVLASWLGTPIFAEGDLSADQLKMLTDPGGWQYIKISDSDNGIQTDHPCFDGRPHPNECSGTLTLTSSNTFIQSVRIHGQTVQRHGTYQLDGNQLTLFDELETRDGPYNVTVDVRAKSMVMQMNPAGGSVRSEFQLEREYRKQLREREKPNSDG